MIKRNDKAPIAVDINVLGKCNMDCGFCWGPSHELGSILDFKQWREIISRLVQKGTKAVIITGGEPLLFKDLTKLLGLLKKNKIRVTLSTNCTLLEGREHKILPFIDEIGIPLDGWSKNSHELMRGNGFDSFNISLQTIEFMKRKYPKIEITVRTLIARPNKEGVFKIGELLNMNKYRPDRWKLYEFLPQNYGAKNKKKYAISNEEFLAFFNKIKKRFVDFKISSLQINERIGRYFIIMPDADALAVGTNGNLVFLGNLVYNFDKTIEEATKYINKTSNMKHGLRLKCN